MTEMGDSRTVLNDVSTYLDKLNLKECFQPLSNEVRKWNCLKGNIITLEGLIGVGKSTAGRSITNYLSGLGFDVVFFPEFMHKPLLEQYLQNMSKYAYSFQVIMVRERLRIYEKAQEVANRGGVAIVDRSLIGDIAFAVMQLQDEIISYSEFEVYISLISEAKITEPTVTLYLECGANEAFQRMVNRNHSKEVDSYQLEYFQKLERAYQETLKEATPPMVKVNWNSPKQIKLTNSQECIQYSDCIELLTAARSYITDL